MLLCRLIDLSKLACLLCNRGFKSAEILAKHRAMSDLHKSNLESLKAKLGLVAMSAMPRGEPGPEGFPKQYRDRAKERRQKYGIASSPPRNRRQKHDHASPPSSYAPPSR